MTSTDQPLKTAAAYLKLLFRLQPARVVAAICLAVASGLLSGCGILLLVPVLEHVGIDGGPEPSGITRTVHWLLHSWGWEISLLPLLLAFVAQAGFIALLARSQSLLNARLKHHFTETLQNRLFKAVTGCGWVFFTRVRISDFTHALTSDLGRVAGGTTGLLNLTSAFVLAVVYGALMVLISPVIAVCALGLMAVLGPLLIVQNRAASQSGRRVTGKAREYYRQIEQQLSGMKEVKCLGAEQRHLADFRRLTSGIRDGHLRYVRSSANTSLIYSLGSAVLLSAVLLAAVEVFRIPPVSLCVLIIVFARLAPRVRQVQSNYQQVLHMLPSFASAMHLQARCEAEKEVVGQASCLPVPASGPGRLEACPTIRLDGVSFRYDKNRPVWALRDVDLTIPARQTTAFVGPSGAGKSTLADLVMGLLPPEEGKVTVDETALSKGMAVWKQAIGYVPQETFLLNDTIRANLLWAEPRANRNDMRQALEMAAADRFVDELPQGLDTVIGNRGVRLSGGQRQRIALARALLRRPMVLILDEATSSLDAENQMRIQHAIRRLDGRLTVVIIAHRLSTVRHADQIVVLDEGRVAEVGTYEELIGRNQGRFRALALADGEYRRRAG